MTSYDKQSTQIKYLKQQLLDNIRNFSTITSDIITGNSFVDSYKYKLDNVRSKLLKLEKDISEL